MSGLVLKEQSKKTRNAPPTSPPKKNYQAGKNHVSAGRDTSRTNILTVVDATRAQTDSRPVLGSADGSNIVRQVGPTALLAAGPRPCGEALVLGHRCSGGMEGAGQEFRARHCFRHFQSPSSHKTVDIAIDSACGLLRLLQGQTTRC